MTRLLYTTISCEVLPGIGKVLMPGAPASADMIRVRKGDEIRLKMAGGGMLTTVAEKHQFMDLEGSAAQRMNVAPGLYAVVVVPDEFLGVGLEDGAEVHLAKSRAVSILDALEEIKRKSESDGRIELALNPADADELRKLTPSELRNRNFEEVEAISGALLEGNLQPLGDSLAIALSSSPGAPLLPE